MVGFDGDFLFQGSLYPSGYSIREREWVGEIKQWFLFLEPNAKNRCWSESNKSITIKRTPLSKSQVAKGVNFYINPPQDILISNYRPSASRSEQEDGGHETD